MTIRYRTRAFILKKEDRGEADQIFTFYTRDFGKIRILGKAIRKIKSKLRGGIGPFSLSEIEFIQGKVYNTLTDANKIKNFLQDSNNFEKIRIFYLIVEVLDFLIKGEEKDKEIWNLLNWSFSELGKDNLPTERYFLIYYYFLWNLSFLLGYGIDLYKCSFCQKRLKPEKNFFHPKKGLFCQECGGKNKESFLVPEEVIKFLRLFQEKKWQIICKIKKSEEYNSSIEIFFKKYFQSLEIINT